MKEVKTPKKPVYIFYIIMAVLLLLVNGVILPSIMEAQIIEVDYGTFLKNLDAKEVRTVQVEKDYIYYIMGTEEEPQVFRTIPFNDDNLVDRLFVSGCEFGQVKEKEANPFITLLVSWVLPIAIFGLIGQVVMRKMGKNRAGGMGMPMMQFGKSNAKVYVASTTSIKFKDVAGEEEAKESLMEIVDFLHSPEKYRKIGASMPKGALLVGPPGTGKTMLAKAVAGEANVPFFSISGSEFVEMFVGMGAAKVRDLFKQANEKAPCIVFIDEIDTIGKKRDGHGMGGNDEREQTLNQLLTEMDGFDGSKGVVILAATNRPETLDPALLRPGRFDRRVPVELPDLVGREAILKVHAQKVQCAPDIDLNAIARTTSGASGAELANIINEAALRAVRMGREKVEQQDLEESVEVVIAGYQKKNKVLSDKEKSIVAYHEIGHALVAALQTDSAPVTKITIIPRTSGALGYTMQMPEEEKYLKTSQELLTELRTLVGGRAAEEVVFNVQTTGASNDIQRATALARNMVTLYGMSDVLGLMAPASVSNQYLDNQAYLDCSQETSALVDKEVQTLLRTCYQESKTLLTSHRPLLDEISEHLLAKETITGDELMAFVNRENEEQTDRSADPETESAEE